MNAWWDILVNETLLVTVRGKETASFMLQYLQRDKKNRYQITLSNKNSTTPINCVTPKDILDLVTN